jgi:hypothetical protein
MIHYIQIQNQSKLVSELEKFRDALQQLSMLNIGSDNFRVRTEKQYDKQWNKLSRLQTRYKEQERDLAILRNKGCKVEYYGSRWLVTKGDKQKSYPSLPDAKKGVAESDLD